MLGTIGSATPIPAAARRRLIPATGPRGAKLVHGDFGTEKGGAAALLYGGADAEYLDLKTGTSAYTLSVGRQECRAEQGSGAVSAAAAIHAFFC